MPPPTSRIGPVLAPALAAALIATPTSAQPIDGAFSPPATVISSHQIDRFEAIGRLQRALRQDPGRLADWVILGELAQEVALDVPASQAGNYLAIARDAYDNALRRSPEDLGLRAALDFVRDQEAHLDAFNRDRDRLTDSYLDARRREVGRGGSTPMLRVYAATPPVTGRAASRAGTAGLEGEVIDPGPAGVPFYAPSYRPVYDGQQPVTYDDYYRSYFPPAPRPDQPPTRPLTARDSIRGPASADPAAVGTMPATAPPAGVAPAPPPPTASRLP